jgi:hypothetical protein
MRPSALGQPGQVGALRGPGGKAWGGQRGDSEEAREAGGGSLRVRADDLEIRGWSKGASAFRVPQAG